MVIRALGIASAVLLLGCSEEVDLTQRVKTYAPPAAEIGLPMPEAEANADAATQREWTLPPASEPKAPEPAPGVVVEEAPPKPVERVGPTQRMAQGHQVVRKTALGQVKIAFVEQTSLVDGGGDRHTTARLSIGVGAKSLFVEAWAGRRVHVGSQDLEVVSVERNVLSYRWRTLTRQKIRSVVRGVEPRDGLLRLPEMGFYRLEDGTVIAVGNVQVAKSTGAVALVPRVTIAVYPADYDLDPLEGYDLHRHVTPVTLLEGWVKRVQLKRVKPRHYEDRGWVELVLLTS